jgi:hypothetical protein
MYSWTKPFTFLIIFILVFGYFGLGRTQTTQQKVDTTKSSVTTDSVRMPPNIVSEAGEIELLEINIEAVIEKPRVAILPKRVEPQLGEMEFVDRSFEKELKKMPDNPMIMDNRLFVPQKIENLKQKLLKKKEKLEKNK